MCCASWRGTRCDPAAPRCGEAGPAVEAIRGSPGTVSECTVTRIVPAGGMPGDHLLSLLPSPTVSRGDCNDPTTPGIGPGGATCLGRGDCGLLGRRRSVLLVMCARRSVD